MVIYKTIYKLKKNNTMTPDEFLKGLNEYNEVFELSGEYEYTEQQLLLFAKLYHENELKDIYSKKHKVTE